MKKRDKQSRAEAVAEPVEVVIDPATYQPTGCIEQDLPVLCRKYGVPEATCVPFQTAPGPPPPPPSAAAVLSPVTTAPAPSTGRGGKATTSASSPSAPSTGRGGKSTARDKQVAAEAAAAVAAAAAAALEAQAVEEPPDPNAPMTYREVSLEKMAQLVCQVRYANEEDKTSLEELRISKWTLGFEYVVALTDMMPLWTQLTDLQLVNTGLDSRTVAMIVYSMESRTSSPPLRNITLDGNEITDIGVVIMLLQGSFKLHKLSLRACKIDDVMCEDIGVLLLLNASLRILDLSLNGLHDAAAISLTKGLRFNRTLLMLSLIGNNITDVGAGCIAEALQLFPLSHIEVVHRRHVLEEQRKRNEPPPQPSGKAKGSLEQRSKSPTSSGRDSTKIPSGKAGRKSDAGSKVSSKKKEEDKGKKADSRLQKTRNKSSMSEVSLSNKDAVRPTEEVGPFAALINDVESHDGKQWCFGNMSLASLDLTGNSKMTEDTAERFIEVLQYQAYVCQERKPPRQGLLRCQVNPRYCPPPPAPLDEPESSPEAQQGLSLSLVTGPLEVPWLSIQQFLAHVDPVARKARHQGRREALREAAMRAAADADVAA